MLFRSILSIERSFNTFLTSQVQDFTSSRSRYETFVNYSGRVDNLLADSESSLSASIQRFFSAFSDVAANPSTLPERQVLIGEANNLADKLRSTYSSLQNLQDEINSALHITVSEVNQLADAIADLNRQIVKASAAGTGAAPNSLLDQRDLLVKRSGLRKLCSPRKIFPYRPFNRMMAPSTCTLVPASRW